VSGPERSATDPAWDDRLRHWLRSAARIAFWPALLLLLAALALELGVLQKQYFIAGPFLAGTDPPQHALFVNVPAESPAPWWRQPMLGDALDKPLRSFLRLRIDGREIGPPHRDPDALRSGTASGFSHRDSVVLFSLPPGVKNTQDTIATLHYSVRLRPWLTLTLAVGATLLGWLGYGHWIAQRLAHLHTRTSETIVRVEQPLAFVLALPGRLILGLGYLALAAAIAFVVASLYAAATGWALPTTALIRSSAHVQWAARNEPHAAQALVCLAALGTIAAWLAQLNPACRQAVARGETRLMRFLFRFGFVIAACAYLFCISAIWSGLARPGDLDFANIGGLIPFSDAANYLTAAHDQAKDGVWNETALWRPLAIAFRSVLLVSGNFSLQAMLILQALLLAGALSFAARAVMLWRGVWAGLVFVALVYLYSRSFAATTLTEPFGLFWALLSIPFLIEAMAGRATRPALTGFTMTVMALMTRTGSMFTLPALLLWLPWQFGAGKTGKLRILAAALCILVGTVGLNAALQRAYGSGQGPATGNFAYVLCGLSMGTGWDGCLKKLAAEGKPLPSGEDTRMETMRAMALENLRTDPTVFLSRLLTNAKLFAENFPEVTWRGYGSEIEEPPWLSRTLLAVISGAGILYLALRVARPVELSFWLLLWLSIVASAAVIYFDDGARALAASQPLISLFFAISLSGPLATATKSVLSETAPRYGWLCLVAAAALFMGVPGIVQRWSLASSMASDGELKPDEAMVFGGRRMSGFVIVEDGSPLRNDVPTLHLKDFDAIIRRSGVEYYQDLLHPVTPPLPFGFVFAPRIEKGVRSLNQFIVPAEVIRSRNVPEWRFQLQRWGTKGTGEYWYRVTHAEPLR
jgi:hypothetical protein